jgi:hypothetical protein
MTTQFSFDDNLYSDLHKDARGYRPRGDHYQLTATDAEKQVLWDNLLSEMDDENARYEAKEIANIASHRSYLNSGDELGMSPAAMLRADMFSYDVDGDVSYYLWHSDIQSFQYKQELEALLARDALKAA